MLGKLLKGIYIVLIAIRRKLSPIIYYMLRYTLYLNMKMPNVWELTREMPIEEFETVINSYNYRPDMLFGAIDSDFQEPDFFFAKRKYFRDCGDFAKLWMEWATHNHINAWEFVIMDGIQFWKGHMFTILQDPKTEKFILCNYKVEGHYDSLEEACEQFKHKELVSFGKYKFPLVMEYKSNFKSSENT